MLVPSVLVELVSGKVNGVVWAHGAGKLEASLQVGLLKVHLGLVLAFDDLLAVGALHPEREIFKVLQVESVLVPGGPIGLRL